MLGLEHCDASNGIPDGFELALPEGHALGEPELLFRTISDDEVAALRARFGGTQDEAAANEGHAAEPLFGADLRVGVVRSVQPHPESSDRLWVLSVEMGGGSVRQVVAGIREHYAEASQLQGRKVVVACNLKAASLRGVESQGMVLCAAKKEALGLLLPPADAQPGARVFAGELRNPGEEVSRAQGPARAGGRQGARARRGRPWGGPGGGRRAARAQRTSWFWLPLHSAVGQSVEIRCHRPAHMRTPGGHASPRAPARPNVVP